MPRDLHRRGLNHAIVKRWAQQLSGKTAAQHDWPPSATLALSGDHNNDQAESEGTKDWPAALIAAIVVVTVAIPLLNFV